MDFKPNNRLRSAWLDAVGLKYSFIDEHAGYPHALLHEVDGSTGKFEPVYGPAIAFEGESPAIAKEQSGLLDPTRGQSVASIARAA